MLGGYRVLAADFHVHSSTWSDGALTPFGLVLEARRQGLDAMAITGHNQVLDAKVGRWFSKVVGGPTVLVGQEVITVPHDLIAVGIDRTIDWRKDLAGQIADVHDQGGIAIAAHPMRGYWEVYAPVMKALDGSEICHPMVYLGADFQREYEQFAAGTPGLAIGSSDFHGAGRIGMCRTYVFARENSAAAILDALRAHRTVVYGPGGRAYGDPALIALAAEHAWLREVATTDAAPGWLDWVSRIAGVVGLAGLLHFGRRDP
jgi:predicted metal-dependent phosphoesterase TrpH